MFDRLELLVGSENILKLKTSNVVVLGLGGVGGYVCEALVRSGIENITIIDYDKIEISNINRQIIATSQNIGNLKTDVMNKRIHLINPNVNVKVINSFIDESNIDKLFSSDIDYFIDACDSIKTKELVISKCLSQNIKFITCLGTGKRMDPSKLTICDIRKTSYDPLAKRLRKYVKDSGIKDKVLCCFSSEEPMKSSSNKIGSNCFVPSSAGLLIASFVVKDICFDKRH